MEHKVKTAVVHYWLVNMRGGEKMLEALLELYPEADIFTHVYNPKAVSPAIRAHRVFTSSVNRLPLSKRLYQLYMPLMPRALMEFNLRDYDLVISSEAGPAKGIVPNPDAYHLCYCHSPMRYLWDLYHEYSGNANFLVRFFMKRIIPSLRIWDICSANLVDRFVTNSHYVAKRIKRVYRRDAEVVYGPVSVEKYIRNRRTPEDFYLFFGQITAYKRLDIALEACVKLGRRLLVAGSGASKKDKAKYEKSGLVEFRGRVSDEEAASLFSRARALLYPGIEDLGLIPIEANAAGCPVIAFREGGVLDTVREGLTGIFFDKQSPDSLMEAIGCFEEREEKFLAREIFTAQVEQFSREAFKNRIKKVVDEKKHL
jgi:glycosyltransferase involved in cell wall biosynthesis